MAEAITKVNDREPLAGAPARHGANAGRGRRPATRIAAAGQGQTEDGFRFTGRGARGLTFERRWTTPGVHPYDEVTWETRRASITNESGKAVFEQDDVEVPTFWSQLATNVVVSKYFYGENGTNERERSVRQLIHRVTRTIADWGRERGYFATIEDGEITRRRSETGAGADVHVTEIPASASPMRR